MTHPHRDPDAFNKDPRLPPKGQLPPRSETEKYMRLKEEFAEMLRSEVQAATGYPMSYGDAHTVASHVYSWLRREIRNDVLAVHQERMEKEYQRSRSVRLGDSMIKRSIKGELPDHVWASRLSTRVKSVLHSQYGITIDAGLPAYLRLLASLTASDIRSMPHLGSKSVDEVRKFLRRFGMHLAGEGK